MKTYTFYWLTGSKELLKGDTPEQALTLAGYGNGAIGALDFYAEGDNHDYTWDEAKRSWSMIK